MITQEVSRIKQFDGKYVQIPLFQDLFYYALKMKNKFVIVCLIIPTLRVFNCYLHLDEATPHLHIDFVPYVTGWKGKGMDTRVSLKQALKKLGISRWEQTRYGAKSVD